jgi:PRC-barrel domain
MKQTDQPAEDADMNTHQRSVAAENVSDRETHELIASDRVEGTNVYRSNGEKVGHIERIMIDKISGKAAYAVMNFGGFLGLGEESYPLPWSVLTYNTSLGGYEVNVTDDQLRRAPSYRRDEDYWDRADANRDSAIYGYWGAPPYWM